MNGNRLEQPITVHHGDLIQFGQIVLRVVQQCIETGPQTIQEDSCDRGLALIQFDQLMTQRAVTPYVQPIVKLNNREMWAAEVLARSRFFGLKDPHSMFAAAKVLNLEGELSRILHEEGIRSGQVLPVEHALFVNTHLVEMDDLDLLIFSLNELRELEPRRPLVLEIHEAAVTCGGDTRTLRRRSTTCKSAWRTTTLGPGQARLVELVDVPPDYLKFDMRLVQNLESASTERQRMMGSLVKMVHNLGIIPLAEGVELEGDHKICQQLGLQFGQGYLHGYPMLPKRLIVDESNTQRVARDDSAGLA